MSDSSPRQEHWQRIWTERSPEQVSWYQPEPAPSLQRIATLGLGPNAGIVDVGGGASLLVDSLMARGFRNLTVLDIAEAALAKAARRLGAAGEGVNWIAADVLSWQPAPASCDLWHDRAVFHFFTDVADQARYARVLDTALAPGGTAIIATFAPDGPEKCSGLPVARHDGASVAAILGAGFRLVDEVTQEHATPAGGLQKFNWCIFKKI